MKHSDDKLTDFILSEIRKAALSEGIDLQEHCGCEHEEPADTLAADTATPDDFEPVNDAENVDIQEVKTLAEEFRRMKELVDFRSPLLRKD